jgi:hypothetical protein
MSSPSTAPSSGRFRPLHVQPVQACHADEPKPNDSAFTSVHPDHGRDLWSATMPQKRAIERARADRRAGRSPSTQAGEFIHEEIDKIRHGEHGARSTRQAIAIGLFEARRAGVKLPPPKRGSVTERTRRSAKYAYEAGQGKRKVRRRPRVSRAVSRALKREKRNAVSRAALSRQAHTAASRRTAAQRSASARKAAHTKGRSGRSVAAKKAAQKRARR